MNKTMVKRTLALVVSAIATSTAFVGCTDYTEFSEADMHHDVVVKDFNERFIKEFGTPDPNHTWGWGITPEMIEAYSQDAKMMTRTDANPLGYGTIDVNRNMWLERDQIAALMNQVHIPGWPNDDGYYYFNNNEDYAGCIPAYEKKSVPAGDVTQYEIEYVSNWVQTHNLDVYQPEIIDALHLSDFFIQEVSRNWDYDRKDDGTIKYPKTRKAIEWTKNGVKGYYTSCDFKLDYLRFKTYQSSDDYNTWTHIDKFNDGYSNKLIDIDGNTPNYEKRNIQYVKSSGTEDFVVQSSASTDKSNIKKYKLIRLTWTEPMADGKEHEREGFYLVFDYQLFKNSEHTGEGDFAGATCSYLGDGYYDNWIIKITPSYYVPRDRWPKRIMCEDRGNTGNDFDFNDAVFDLTYSQNITNPNKMDLVVVIQAAGATMPIYVAKDPGNVGGDDVYNPTNKLWEIHNLLGQEDWSKPINVINGQTAAIPAIYRIPTDVDATASWSDMQSSVPQIRMAINAFTQRIHIYNKYEKKWYSVSGAELQQNLRAEGEGQGYSEGSDGKGVKGTNPAPQLINTSVNCAWVVENGNIGLAYPRFKEWVANEKCEYRLKWDATKHFGLKATSASKTPPYAIDDYEIADNTNPPYPTWIYSWDDVTKQEVNRIHLYTPSIPDHDHGNKTGDYADDDPALHH